ncbi:MAG: isoprenylcysteine carboxylmethyltransferase family protein [Ignavibacteria bacterium]|jgi:protein-S-isoprenylcysteine O-methyltransferase Ste14
MNNFIRIFGSGPIGLFISLALLYLAFYLKDILNTPSIFGDRKFIPLIIFILLTAVSIVIIIWSLISLSPKQRGRTLITTGALKYFRHPLYAAFLSFFNFGLAFFLNNWIFIFWAIFLHPIWHLLVIGEEKLLKNIFPNDYEKYCENTGRFFPKLFKKNDSKMK